MRRTKAMGAEVSGRGETRLAIASPLAFCPLVLLIIALGLVPTAAIIDPADFLALQSIRRSLDDLPGSDFFSSWDFTADPCHFAGVLCSGDRVAALALGDSRAGSPGLSGRLSPAVGRLSALAELSLSPGRVAGPLPPTITCLSNLRFLALSRNFLSGVIPPEIGALRQLRNLDLGFNQLCGPIPSGLANIPTLSNLILCKNHLTGPMPSFGSPSLVRLDLKENNLSGGLPAVPPSLQYLSLSRNRLTGPVDWVLPGLVGLNYLDLSMNQLTGQIPPCIFSFPITTLQLQRNMFSGPVTPGAAVVIPTVDLSYNRLYGEISPMLSSVTNLYLNNNRFTGKVPASFVGRLLNSGMHILYLQHNYLTGIQMDPAAVVPASSSLCLQYNCMVPPAQAAACPLKAGRDKSRPTAQCPEWRG